MIVAISGPDAVVLEQLTDEVTAALEKGMLAPDDATVEQIIETKRYARYVYGAMPEEWIRALGKLIVKIHVKDFKLNPDGHGGKFVDIRDGSVDWPLVRKELDKIGYNGWMTIEGSGKLSLEERSKRLDLIIAGK